MGKKQKHGHRDKKKEIPMKFFYGIPHSHTGYSTGKGNPTEALSYAKSKGLHFLFITDHNKYLSESIKTTKKQITKWESIKKLISHFNKENKYFLGVRGCEIKIKSVGDLNLINSSNHISGTVKDLNKLSTWIQEENCIGIINHPGTTMEKLKKLPELNKYVMLMEVGNGIPPKRYNRYFKQYFDFLDAGWKIGAVNGQDNHQNNWGDSSNLTVVVAEKLDSKEILKALKERRTYSTESRSLKLMFKINNVIMGSTAICRQGEFLNFAIYVEDYEVPIEKVEILSTGGTVIKEMPNMEERKLKFEFTIPVSVNEKWYVVKIKQSDDRLSLSSPVFIDII